MNKLVIIGFTVSALLLMGANMTKLKSSEAEVISDIEDLETELIEIPDKLTSLTLKTEAVRMRQIEIIQTKRPAKYERLEGIQNLIIQDGGTPGTVTLQVVPQGIN